MISEEKLIAAAFDARTRAYAPYSKFKVGAALLTGDGDVISGCNIECAAFGVTNCAERTALFSAVSQGSRTFSAIAIVGGGEKEGEGLSCYCPPCGVCRQMLREFCAPESFRIILARSLKDYQVYTLEELLPMSFGPENLQK